MPQPSPLPGRSPFLATPQWVGEHLDDQNLVLLDGTFVLPTRETSATQIYLSCHLPGAQRFDVDIIKDPSSALPHMLPNAADMTRHLQNLGIGENSLIVIYDQQGLFGAARVWWMLRCFGLQSFILDSGLPRWLKEGRQVESGEVKHAASRIEVELDPRLVADKAKVQAALKNKTAQVVDARPAGRFRGAAAEPRANLRSGHMPGAINLPYAELIENGSLKNLSELRDIIATAGIDIKKPVISSCGSGVSAAILCLTLASLGSEAWSLYDGSWAEWGASADCAVIQAA